MGATIARALSLKHKIPLVLIIALHLEIARMITGCKDPVMLTSGANTQVIA